MPNPGSDIQRENFLLEREISHNSQVSNSTEQFQTIQESSLRRSTRHRQDIIIFDPGYSSASKWQDRNVARMDEIINDETGIAEWNNPSLFICLQKFDENISTHNHLPKCFKASKQNDPDAPN